MGFLALVSAQAYKAVAGIARPNWLSRSQNHLGVNQVELPGLAPSQTRAN
jgi:hypothetical protein